MKTSVIVAFSFTCLLICITAGADPEPVLDILGHVVRPGVRYHILTAIGGGLTLINPNNTCPLYVVHEPIFHGKPVIFTPLDGEDEILTSTDLNITSFVNPATTPCNKTLQWSLGKGSVPRVWFTVAGDDFSEVTIYNINIDKFGTEDYVLSFCSALCPGCPTRCNKLGLFEAEDGYKHLAQNYQIPPLGVQFKRAH
ncbi:hypothetical protein RIF29_06303 [Crotalaria pallida]|uniref:Uncharacterized protein n=1 Tax=Crotalaria pallida TaxID=3830 RepID=A0AAN9PB70_CROPI